MWVMRTAPQNATRPLEGENPTPVFPSVRASSFRCPVRSTPGPAILSFKRGHSPLSPIAVTKVAGQLSRRPPGCASRFHCRGFTPATGTPGNLSCRLLVAPPPGTIELRALCFRGPKEVGASKTKFFYSWTWRREIDRRRCATTRDHEAARVLTWREIGGLPILGNQARPGFQRLDVLRSTGRVTAPRQVAGPTVAKQVPVPTSGAD